MENVTQKESQKERLRRALIHLCSEKNYFDITISEICQQANTYRSAFYLYYDNKDDLLREVEHQYILDLDALCANFKQYRPKFEPDAYWRYREDFVKAMYYHYEHRNLYIFLMSPEGDPYFGRLVRKHIQRISEGGNRREKTPVKVNQEYGSNFFFSGYAATVYQWLVSDNRTPEEMADFMMSMLMLFAEKCH